MGKPKIDPPTGTVNRIPSWQKALLDEHVTALPGLLVRHALDAASAAERSEQGKRSAERRHEEKNNIKEMAREYYLNNRQIYKSQKEAARDLANQFDKIAFGTFKNLVSKWSKE